MYILIGIANSLDMKQQPPGVENDEDGQGKATKDDLVKVIPRDDISRTTWLRASDQNARFLHGMANLHRKFNLLLTMVVGGNCFVARIYMKSSVPDLFFGGGVLH